MEELSNILGKTNGKEGKAIHPSRAFKVHLILLFSIVRPTSGGGEQTGPPGYK